MRTNASAIHSLAALRVVFALPRVAGNAILGRYDARNLQRVRREAQGLTGLLSPCVPADEKGRRECSERRWQKRDGLSASSPRLSLEEGDNVKRCGGSHEVTGRK